MNRQFTTTTIGLNRQSPIMRLFEKAKRLGIWNPSDLPFHQDIKDWKTLQADERDLILRLTTLFQAGEEAVTLDLLPLIMTIAREGRLEEELYLTTFLFEEAKHTDFFRRFLDEVAGVADHLNHYLTDNYKIIFEDALPSALQRLQQDSSPLAQVQASVTYNMIVEGILAETGYHAYFTVLESRDLLPGTRQGIAYLKQDESRHIAYGVFLLSRLLAEHPDLWNTIETTMNTLLMPAIGVIQDAFACYEVVPFGLEETTFTNYAMMQYQKRYERLLKARGANIDDIYQITQAVIDENDA